MNLNHIDELIEKMNKASLSEVEYKDKDVEIKLKKAVAPTQMPAQPAVQSTPVKEEAPTPQKQQPSGKVIKAPMVGTFYKAPSPEAEAFVKVGDKVNNDTVVCILEAMKLFNEIEAEMNGEIVEILIEDGEMVEYNQPMFIIR
ncbi:MAG TPA: acetyl-CoA carboxylase biotin carboxyl carrier protein [Aliicoccus persicus]|uniref:Biotin carboxyl carrier protein of acetyl-CoA carboxylase n=1 Tax=Aliicoccus persicus TaxID=930138 RepID=A0A921DVB7_9STAP|nr:acetyl-CoA carboxylase biotin carboxyl carrier protein [Aliicoccus persicus]